MSGWRSRAGCFIGCRLPPLRSSAWSRRECWRRFARWARRAVEAEEHLQAARVRLLVDDGGSRLKGYRGLGSFDAFVTTVAVRALSNARQAVRPSDDEKAIAALPAAADLERALSRSGQQQHFAEAFRGALAALSARERALLRLNLVEGASIDELAPMYAVSRATVARWLASAKQALQHQTISALSLHTRVQGPELEHLLTSLQSGFDLSLRRFVAEAAVEERGP